MKYELLNPLVTIILALMLTHATAAVAPVAAKPNIVLIIHDLRPPEA